MHLVHRSLPERSLAEIDLRTSLAGIPLAQPVIINAMTGGAAGVAAINRDLARVAAELGLAMAVGSETAGLREPEVAYTYQVVREENPDGVMIANVSAGVTLAEAKAAVELIRADLLQVHLNAPQELVMAEGDREFGGQLARIAELVAAVPVPVVVKECGFGIGRETAQELYATGVQAIDISGRGGTNFAWIEAQRRGAEIDPGLLHWGMPTPVALAEVAALDLPGLAVIASGGITYGTDAAKALAMGARAVGVAGALLRRYHAGGILEARAYLATLLQDLACAVLLTGSGDLAELRQRPVVITGETGAWCRLRGVPLERWAQR